MFARLLLRKLAAAAHLLLAASLLLSPAAPVFALDEATPLRHLGHQSWQTGTGLPQNTVHAVLQTSDGFLWVATEGGLLRYDGADFTIFDKRNTPALRSDLILSLAEAADGTLLAGTAGGLLTLSGGRLRLFTTADGLPADTVPALACTAAGCWVLTMDGVAFFHDGQFSPAPLAMQAGSAGAHSGGGPIAAPAPDGSLWVATAAGVAHLSAGRVLETVTVPGPVVALAAAVDGSVWIGTRNTLLHYSSGQLTPQPLPRNIAPALLLSGKSGVLFIGTSRGLAVLDHGAVTFLTTANGLPGNRVDALFEDRRGGLWISTDRGVARLLIRLVKGAVDTFALGEAIGGSGNPLLGFFEDREGNVWLGTDGGGLTVLRDEKFTTFTTADGLAANLVRSLYAGRDGTVWLGTDGGGLSRFRNGAFLPPLTTREGLSSNTILSLAEGADGAMWVGTPDGLDRVRNGKVDAVLTSAEGLPDDFIRSLLATGRWGAAGGGTGGDDLWIGTRHGLAQWAGGGVRGSFSTADGLGSDVVGALLDAATAPSPAAATNLWAGTLGGLSRIADGRITNLTTHDGLSSRIITALASGPDGALWIGTSGGGLNLYEKNRVTAFPPKETGLPETISSILEDAHGNLWLGTPAGIARVSVRDLRAYITDARHALSVANYGVADGMRIAECSSGHPAAVRTADGALWFATLKGVSVVHPERTPENPLAPPVAIENITVDEQPVNAAVQTGSDTQSNPLFEVAPGRSRAAFHYAGLSFVAPFRVRYRYRLEGFDRQWIDAGARRTAYYTNIPPGRYVFRVLAANNDGVWNQTGASVRFRVLPHFYQTWWFYTLLALALTALAFEVYRLRVRQVESRFAAVLGERTRIAREIHDTLAQDIVGISVQLELVSRLLSTSVDAASAQLEQARTQVRRSLAEARSSIWNLRSGGADSDLPARLSKAANELTRAHNLKLAFQVHGTYRAAPRAVEDQLLRIGGEAMNNVARHAAATRLEVTLIYDARSLRLMVADNGRGFHSGDDQAFTAGGHFGLAGMRERAAEIGGELVVVSQPADGTRISVRVDIP